eukprot:4193550-Alexandrium_andersonii.AAC.2
MRRHPGRRAASTPMRGSAQPAALGAPNELATGPGPLPKTAGRGPQARGAGCSSQARSRAALWLLRWPSRRVRGRRPAEGPAAAAEGESRAPP